MKLEIKILVIFLMVNFISNAQVQLQSFAGNDGLQFSSIIQKNIGAKTNYLGFSNYYSPYNSYEKGELESYNVLNYQLYKNLGIATGATFSSKDITPQIGFSWSVDKEKINFNLFPAINYSLNHKEVGLGLYSLFEYTPKINKKWNSYNMLIVDSDFTFKEHTVSNQYLRIGLEYKSKFQFGLGINFSENGDDFKFDNSYGIFMGYTL